MAGEEGSQTTNIAGEHNGGDVTVTSTKGTDPASTPEKNGKTVYDIIANIYLAPFLALIEVHIWKTRVHHHKERHECLHEFVKAHPRAYKCVVIADIICLVLFILAALFFLFAVSYAVLQGGIKLSGTGL